MLNDGWISQPAGYDGFSNVDLVRALTLGFEIPSVFSLGSFTIDYRPALVFTLRAALALGFTISTGNRLRMTLATGPAPDEQPVLILGQ